ncbi:MAG: FTR1 family protein [Elusimicrobia bacterium]|nr:FTR1 family protein [Elusimicrobiota bacterium]
MIASALIVFREALEAALVIGIVLGATRGLKGRKTAVAWGVGSGIMGALVVAALMGRIAQAASGTGQALFEAAVLFTAVAMLGWHSVWMSRHGKRLAQDLKNLGSDVTKGLRPATALYAAAALAVLREGSEIVLFLYGLAASGAGAGALCLGGLIGLSAGAAAGGLLYLGLVRIPVRLFFRVTGWMIVLLAAGMASQAAAFLNQADLLPSIKDSLWDTSRLLSAQSVLGTLLKTLVGYTPSPSGLQMLFYAGTIALIASLTKLAEE